MLCSVNREESSGLLLVARHCLGEIAVSEGCPGKPCLVQPNHIVPMASEPIAAQSFLQAEDVDRSRLLREAKRLLSDEHIEGLTVLGSRNMATNAEVMALIEADSPLLRTYGATAAKQLERDRPELLDAGRVRTPRDAKIVT